MAYDEELADRLRELLQDEPALTTKKMFGGLAFLIGGNMAVACSGDGLLLRADPARSDEYVDDVAVSRAVMRGRLMDGWLRVTRGAVDDDAGLERYARIGADYARSLPPK